ncbi:hypothetical protein LSTR_LSTR012256 [Laodelphax striatellus]|uniref:Uncharacterized protein n=1 Tax=Laodelphax striatellus TaxID=195883 RepID=A0A482WK75_LAOST|nr:hypothetical protein LSTR_LSTR012256 [Laodelphax striatellus]
MKMDAPWETGGEGATSFFILAHQVNYHKLHTAFGLGLKKSCVMVPCDESAAVAAIPFVRGFAQMNNRAVVAFVAGDADPLEFLFLAYYDIIRPFARRVIRKFTAADKRPLLLFYSSFT